MKNIFESKKEDFEIKEYKVKIKNINDNDGHFYFNAKTKKIINLNNCNTLLDYGSGKGLLYESIFLWTTKITLI